MRYWRSFRYWFLLSLLWLLIAFSIFSTIWIIYFSPVVPLLIKIFMIIFSLFFIQIVYGLTFNFVNSIEITKEGIGLHFLFHKLNLTGIKNMILIDRPIIQRIFMQELIFGKFGTHLQIEYIDGLTIIQHISNFSQYKNLLDELEKSTGKKIPNVQF